MIRKPLSKDRGARGNSQRQAGFSLIEMLTVIVIVLILSGVIYRIGSYATRRAGVARTIYELELLHNIMEEYYAVYGYYPPAEGAGEFDDVNNISGGSIYPDTWNNYLVEHRGALPNDWMNEPGQADPKSTYGSQPLLWFIHAQYEMSTEFTGPGGGSINNPYAASAAERREYQTRWAHLLYRLEDFTPYDAGGSMPVDFDTTQHGFEGGNLVHSNAVAALRDPYGNYYEYETASPYQYYRLYSVGPDGKRGTDDDIGRDRWVE